MKKCPKCSNTKEDNEFYTLKSKRGITSWCKICLRERKRKVYRTNPRHGIEAVRKANYKRYGLTPEQYNEMLQAQGGGCKICGGIQKNGRLLEIDHNHKTGKTRGLLCHPCNMVLGSCKDNMDILRLSIKYLQEYDNKE